MIVVIYWNVTNILFFSQQYATIINIKSPTSLTSNKYLPTVDRLSLIRTDRDFLASVGKPLWKYWVGWDRVDPSSEIQIIRIYHRSNRNGSNYLMDFNLVFKYHSMNQYWYTNIDIIHNLGTSLADTWKYSVTSVQFCANHQNLDFALMK